MSDATDLADCSANELLRLYRSGAASPVEAARAVLARIERFNPLLNAFCHLAGDQALASARASEARWKQNAPSGALDGVPVSIKDLILVKGMPTLRGSRTVDPAQPWDVDAPVTARLREAGAVILGKTTTPEFGCKGETNSPLTGITRNPWNPSSARPGGSSGGTAASIACRHGPALGRHRRRRQRPHPGRVLRQLRPEAELRPRAGVSALAVRQRRPSRPAHDVRRRRRAGDERDEAA